MIGDIWLTQYVGKNKLSRFVGSAITFIKHGIHTEYSHTMVEVVVDGREMLVSAQGGKVRLVPPNVYSTGPYNISVRRKPGVPMLRRERVALEAMYQTSLEYGYLTAGAHVLSRKVAAWFARRAPRKRICSQVVGYAYLAIGHKFGKRMNYRPLHPDELRPRDIEWSTRDWEEVLSKTVQT